MPYWYRTETRTVRSFPSVDACLHGVGFGLSQDTVSTETTSFDPNDIEPGAFEPRFSLDVDMSALHSSPVASLSHSMDLVIRLADARLHRSEIVFRSELGRLPNTWVIPANVRDRFAWKHGVEASVALLMTSNRPVQLGQPFMRGHWVARKDFSIRAKSEPRALPIERWAAEDFERCGLPGDTVYWVQFNTEELNTRFDDLGAAFRVCVRADVYDALLASEEAPYARAMCSVFAAEIVSEVLWRGLRNLEEGEAIERGGLLHSVVAQCIRKTGAKEQTLRRLATDGEFSSLRTFAQATVGARQFIAKLGART